MDAARTRKLQVGGAYPEGTEREAHVDAPRTLGIEERVDGFVYVWFFDRVLGRYQRGERTVQPLPVDERDAALMRDAATPS